MGFFSTKNHHFGVFWGYHHLRKHPYVYQYSPLDSHNLSLISGAFFFFGYHKFLCQPKGKWYVWPVHHELVGSHDFFLFGCFLKWWYPQIIHFNRVFHYKASILGYPYFWKHPFQPETTWTPSSPFRHVTLPANWHLSWLFRPILGVRMS